MAPEAKITSVQLITNWVIDVNFGVQWLLWKEKIGYRNGDDTCPTLWVCVYNSECISV